MGKNRKDNRARITMRSEDTERSIRGWIVKILEEEINSPEFYKNGGIPEEQIPRLIRFHHKKIIEWSGKIYEKILIYIKS